MTHSLNEKKAVTPEQRAVIELRNQILTCLLLANSAPQMSDDEFLDWSKETTDKIMKTILSSIRQARQEGYEKGKKDGYSECYEEVMGSQK